MKHDTVNSSIIEQNSILTERELSKKEKGKKRKGKGEKKQILEITQ